MDRPITGNMGSHLEVTNSGKLTTLSIQATKLSFQLNGMHVGVSKVRQLIQIGRGILSQLKTAILGTQT